MVADFRTMGLPALVSFNAVARTGGITQAAASLGMAKSGVSRHMAQLEAHFGARLLERGARSVRLTKLGQRLDQRIASILAEIELLSDIAREESANISGKVSIAATPEFGGLLATTLFPQIRAQHPDLTLVMRPDYEFEDMQNPDTDLAFRIGSVSDERLVARPLGAFRRVLVASPDLNFGRLSSPADLAQAPCLTFREDRGTTLWRLKSTDTSADVRVTAPVSVRSFAILHRMAIASEGIAFLPDFMVCDDLSTGRLQRCLPAFSSGETKVFLTYRPGSRKIARVDAVITAAEKHVPDILEESALP